MSKKNHHYLGERLRAWRKGQSLKGYELANIIEISSASISEIENGKSLPSADTLTRLHQKTNINIAWLLTGQGFSKRDVVEESYEGHNNSITLKISNQIDKDATDQLNDTVEKFVRVYMNADSVKKAQLMGFLNGAEPGA